MPILIDGHNLIAKMPDLDLQDPHDEAKLVEQLRRHQARTGKRLTVIFDGGLPGGLSRDLSTGKIKVIFAPHGRSADALIVRRVRRSRDPRGLTVISSDRRVAAAAEARGARVVRSETFAQELSAPYGSAPPEDVILSPDEVQEWLTLFGEADQQSDQ